MGAESEVYSGDQAQELASLCRQLTDYSPLPMAAAEGDRHVLRYANPAFCRLVGKDFEALIGRPFAEVVPQADGLLEPLERVLQTGEPETHLEQKQSGATALHWSYVLWPVAATERRPVGIIIQPTDSTETALFRLRATEMNQELMLSAVRLHELTEAANESAASLERANEAFERSNRDLEQFAYIASHDLQEPLRAITGHLGLLARRYKGKMGGDADEFIGCAVDGAKRLSELIAALLDYSRIGRTSKPAVPVDPEGALRTALSGLQAAISQHNAEVTHDALPTVMADEILLAQVFQNLIGNAIKFHREGEPPRVHISARPEGEMWKFAVSDNGIGIDLKYQQRIFNIFEQLHSPGEYGGSGIGLSICKRIIAQLGGEICLESKPGEGTTFYFTLPNA